MSITIDELEYLQEEIKAYFRAYRLNSAVVGFSGGIDSTVTALLMKSCGISTTLVVTKAPNQRYSSRVGEYQSARNLVSRLE